MTKSLYLLPGLFCALGACGEAIDRPISISEHGRATRTNLAAQIINPLPPRHARQTSHAKRSTLAVERLRADEIKQPAAISTAGAAGDTDG